MEPDASVLPEFVLIAPSPRTNPRTKVTQPSLCDSWLAALKDLPESVSSRFKVKEAKLDPAVLAQEFGTFECLVSPANAFGIMDGGYDMALSRIFSVDKDIWVLTNAVQDVLKCRHRGYLPPASCTLVPLTPVLTTSNPLGCKVLAVVPTMRTPEDVSWHIDLVYDSMWNLLTALWQWNEGERPNGAEPIKRVLMTGLATGNGGIGFDKCARQMFLAALNFARGWGDHPRWDGLMDRCKEMDHTRDVAGNVNLKDQYGYSNARNLCHMKASKRDLREREFAGSANGRWCLKGWLYIVVRILKEISRQEKLNALLHSCASNPLGWSLEYIFIAALYRSLKLSAQASSWSFRVPFMIGNSCMQCHLNAI